MHSYIYIYIYGGIFARSSITECGVVWHKSKSVVETDIIVMRNAVVLLFNKINK